MLIDDLQWTDRETLVWLEHLFHFDPAAKVLVVGMIRPVEGAANKALRTLTTTLKKEKNLLELPLTELSESETGRLIALTSKNRIDDKGATFLYKETEGNPLFIIESVREGSFGVERKQKNSLSRGFKKEGKIPSKVKEVILARFAHLSRGTRDLMGLAAAMGREFEFRLLVKAFGKEEALVVDLIEVLLEQHIVRELREETYDFTHDKIREVAYLEMSAARRRLFHRQIAEAIEAIHHHAPEQYHSRLAFHYDRSGDIEQAIRYYRKSAQSARDLFADSEAVTYLRRALKLLEKIPDGEDRVRLERDLQIDLILSLYPLTGYSGKEVMKSCNRILELCNKLGESPDAPVVRYLGIGNIAIGRIDEGVKLGRQLHDHALKNSDRVELVESDYMLGSAAHYAGKFKEAKKYFLEGVEMYDPNLHPKHIQRYGQNPMLMCKVRLAVVLWVLGATEKADKLEQEVLQEAKDMNHPLSLSYIICWSCWLQNLKNNPVQSYKVGKQYFEKPIYGEFPAWCANTKALCGSALFRMGQIKEGITLMREGIEINERINVWILTSYFKCLLAEALADQGKAQEAFTLVDEAFYSIHRTKERWLESEMYRLKGCIHLKEDLENLKEARYCFHKAVEVAQRQGAVPFVEKASTALKKLGEGSF